MRRISAVAAALLVLLVAVALPVEAHAPEFTEGSGSLEDAIEIDDPTKSWVIYSHLPDGEEAHYYLLKMDQGENITVSLTVPRSQTDEGFVPSMVLMGPGIDSEGAVPPFVQVPEGAGARVVTGVIPEHLEYEPFSPSAFYELGKISVQAPEDGDYYLVVYDLATGGNYGLAVGLRESFTAEEWLLIPFNGLSIYQWEGQSLVTILAGPAAVFLIGLAIMLGLSTRRPQGPDVLWLMATVAGLLMIASGTSVAYQMLWALSQTGWEGTALVTLLFALASFALGFATLRIGHRGRSPRALPPRSRIALLVIGGLGLLVWAGWIVGPAIAILAAVLPAAVLLRGSGRARRIR